VDQWILEFNLVGGEPVGRVVFDGSEMTADPGLSGIVDEDDDPADIVQRFDGWSNGYVQSRKI
jgi:hypothetical protein